jgi:predicted DNA-binding mobile mystery protein A
MKPDIKHQRRSQLDKVLANCSSTLPANPKRGWIAEIRDLLQMTSAQLARRLGVTQSVVSALEKSERNKTISVKSLEKAANALECDLYITLIPRKGLEAELYSRAEALWELRHKQIQHHMRLEDQGIVPDEIRAIAQRAYEILELYGDVWKQD